MPAKTLLLLCWGILSLSDLTWRENSDQALLELIQAEREFSKRSEARGIREAFLTYLAPDSIVFHPRPVSGREVYEKVPTDSPILLTWEPAYAEVSSTGDLGYTTGPYELRDKSHPGKPGRYGHYVSVWERQPDGLWKVVLDIGNSHPRPESKVEGVVMGKADSKAKGVPKKNLEKEQARLIEADRAFSRDCQAEGIVKAYLIHSAEDIRFYRQGSNPATGRKSVEKILSAVQADWTWIPSAAGISSSAALGYTYGLLEEKEVSNPDKKKLSSYMRIWRRDDAGKWLVALDITIPVPSSQKSEGE